MASTIENPNKFSPQFLADMKAGNKRLYGFYIHNAQKMSINVSLTLASNGQAVWTVTNPNNETNANEPNNGGTAWFSFPSSQNKGLGKTLSDASPGVEGIGKAYNQFGQKVDVPTIGYDWNIPGWNSDSRGTGIIPDANGKPTSFQIRFASADTGNAKTGYMPYVADPSITSLKQLQALQSVVWQSYDGTDLLFTNHDLDNILNYGSGAYMGPGRDNVPTYTVDANTGTVTVTKDGETPLTVTRDYTKYKYDENGNLRGVSYQPLLGGVDYPTITTVPKTKPPVTPTTVPKPPVTPTTVPKPPVTPTTVPKPPVIPTTVPKPPVTPTTVPKPTPTPTTTPKPPVTPITPTTIPPTTPTTLPKTTGTSVPSITPTWGASTSSGYSFTWPDAAYLKQLGLPDNVANSLGGTKLITTGLPKTYGGIIQGIVEQLGDENARKFFQPWINNGFDPFAYRDSKKLTQFNRDARTFMPTVLSKGYANVDPTQFSTGGATTPGTAGPAGTVVGSGAGTSAYGVIAQKLSDWGMDDLIPKFYDYVFKSNVTDGRQLLQALRQEPEYKQTFIGLDKYNANNPRPMTEAQYLATAQKMLDTADAYGLPRSFFSKQEIGQLIGGGVSAAEFNRRLSNGYQVAVNADPATKAYLQKQGVDMGHLLAYFLDPKKAEPILTQKTTTAQLQGYAQNVGVKNFNEAMAEELARSARTKINADGTFSTTEEKKALDFAGAGAQLTGAAPGANATTVNTTQLIGSQLAGFGGTTQAESDQQVQRAAQAQAAPFQKGGGYTTDQQGVTGLGSARQ